MSSEQEIPGTTSGTPDGDSGKSYVEIKVVPPGYETPAPASVATITPLPVASVPQGNDDAVSRADEVRGGTLPFGTPLRLPVSAPRAITPGSLINPPGEPDGLAEALAALESVAAELESAQSGEAPSAGSHAADEDAAAAALSDPPTLQLLERIQVDHLGERTPTPRPDTAVDGEGEEVTGIIKVQPEEEDGAAIAKALSEEALAAAAKEAFVVEIEALESAIEAANGNTTAKKMLAYTDLLATTRALLERVFDIPASGDASLVTRLAAIERNLVENIFNDKILVLEARLEQLVTSVSEIPEDTLSWQQLLAAIESVLPTVARFAADGAELLILVDQKAPIFTSRVLECMNTFGTVRDTLAKKKMGILREQVPQITTAARRVFYRWQNAKQELELAMSFEGRTSTTLARFSSTVVDAVSFVGEPTATDLLTDVNSLLSKNGLKTDETVILNQAKTALETVISESRELNAKLEAEITRLEGEEVTVGSLSQEPGKTPALQLTIGNVDRSTSILVGAWEIIKQETIDLLGTAETTVEALEAQRTKLTDLKEKHLDKLVFDIDRLLDGFPKDEQPQVLVFASSYLEEISGKIDGLIALLDAEIQRLNEAAAAAPQPQTGDAAPTPVLASGEIEEQFLEQGESIGTMPAVGEDGHPEYDHDAHKFHEAMAEDRRNKVRNFLLAGSAAALAVLTLLIATNRAEKDWGIGLADSGDFPKPAGKSDAVNPGKGAAAEPVAAATPVAPKLPVLAPTLPAEKPASQPSTAADLAAIPSEQEQAEKPAEEPKLPEEIMAICTYQVNKLMCDVAAGGFDSDGIRTALKGFRSGMEWLPKSQQPASNQAFGRLRFASDSGLYVGDPNQIAVVTRGKMGPVFRGVQNEDRNRGVNVLPGDQRTFRLKHQ